MQQLRDTTAHDADALRARFADDGYLLVRGLVDVDCVGRLAASVLAILDDQGLQAGGADAVDRFRATRSSYYTAVQRLEIFHALAHDPALQRVVRALVGDDAFVHPRKLLRALLPDIPELTTPPHQDFPYIRGTKRTVTTWLPLRSCRGAEGALRVLLGSHLGEILKSKPSPTFAGAQADVDDADPAWASSDFEPGDVLMFQSTTVHGATLNTSGRIRLSADYRHQSASEPVSISALKPTGYPGVADWPELLAGIDWPSQRWITTPAHVEIVDAEPDPP
jgi:hypothetical protein